MKKCKCKGFKRSNTALMKIFKFAWDSELKALEEFPDCFTHCPWCGKLLDRSDENEDIYD